MGAVNRLAPPPSSYTARRTMQANRSTDTTPERRLRSELHGRGLRYRKDRRFVAAGQKVRPDLVFAASRVAVFVDGCFWHRCPIHATDPRSNADYWREKFKRNVARDRANDAALQAAGWTVVRVWEHEDVAEAADRVEVAVARSNRRNASQPLPGQRERDPLHEQLVRARRQAEPSAHET